MAISPFSATWRNDIIKALAGLEPLNDTLSAIAALTGEPDKGIYFTGEDSAALFTLTEFARTLLDDDDASSVLITLGVSEFAKTLLDDADASAALTTLGVSAFIKTLLDDADATAARQTLGANDASNLTQGTLPAARVPADLPADKAYRRGNVLGTVSQSGGVPTGAIIESGSNANGSYVRIADGTQICTTPSGITLGATTTTTSGVYRSASAEGTDYSWTFPADFSEPPRVSADVGRADMWATGFSVSATSTSLVGFSADFPRTDIACYGMAIGRWF